MISTGSTSGVRAGVRPPGAEAGTRTSSWSGPPRVRPSMVQNPGVRALLTGCERGEQRRDHDPPRRPHPSPAGPALHPPDLFVPNARSTGPTRSTPASTRASPRSLAAIEEDFGIPIQHAVSLNFDQFANIVDALGGINMAFPVSVFDWAATGGRPAVRTAGSSGLNLRAAACVHSNGTQALEVVRARHLRYETPASNRIDPYSWHRRPRATSLDPARPRVPARAGQRRRQAGTGNPITDINLINRSRAT